MNHKKSFCCVFLEILEGDLGIHITCESFLRTSQADKLQHILPQVSTNTATD